MKGIKGFTITAIFTVMLVLVTAFCVSGTVNGKGKQDARAREQYYHAAEQEYVQEIRNFLEERGYCNSGVTMNSVIWEDGSREYTVLIHHRRIEKLSDEQRETLITECRSIAFPVENCSLSYEFLETDL